MNALEPHFWSNITTLGATLLADAAIKGVVLLAAVMVVVRCMRGWSAATRHFVLFSTVAVLLLLPLLSGLLPNWHALPPWLQYRQSHPVEQNGFGVTTAFLQRDAVTTTVSSVGLASTEDVSVYASSTPSLLLSSVPELPENHRQAQRWSLWHWGLVIWSLGAGCFLARTILGSVSLGLLARNSEPRGTSEARNVLQSLSASLGVERSIELLVTPRRQMPMTWGILRPKIVLPESSYSWSEGRLRVVLLHELAHIKRQDCCTNLVTQLVCAVYWFNPLVWWVARRISSEREQACDDLVLNEGARPAIYAEEVLQIAARTHVHLFDACSAIAMARPSSLEGRLLAILDGKRNRASLSRTTMLAVTLLLGIIIIPVSMMRAAQRPQSGFAAIDAEPQTEVSPPVNGLIACWSAEGDAKDSAGGHHGGASFGLRFGPGVVGQAFDFRRTYAIEHLLQRVSIPDDPAFGLSDAMTLEAWVYPRIYGGVILLRGDDRGGYDTWQLDVRIKGYLSFGFNSSDNQGAGISTPIQLGQWQHVVATFDRGEMRLYINGTLVSQGRTGLRPIKELSPHARPALGIGNAGGEFYNIPFDGLIDEVRIYNRALTEAEIIESLGR